MAFTNTFKTFTITENERDNLHKILTKLKFEIIEIWTPDDNDEIEVWTNTKLKETLNIKIHNVEENENVSRIVYEIIDLWHELRAIRDVLEADSIEYNMYEKPVKKTSFEIYNEKLKETEEDWENNKFKNLFKENIDPSVLTYLELDEEDKLALTN